MFKRAQADIRYHYRGNRSSVAEYLSRNPVTGLLIAKDDQILCEYYQYGRTDHDRFISQSMAKSIAAMRIDATWVVDAQGFEVGMGSSTPCSATTRGSGASLSKIAFGKAGKSFRRNT